MDSQQMLEFAPDRSTAGFRLHACSVFNWGTFHERVQSFLPGGRTAILTGANGSGKSTLADALLTLLVEGRRRNYNIASNQAGARKERSEKDYVLGAYSERHDDDIGRGRRLYLRKPGETYTVLLAHFHNETFQSHVSLAQVLWVGSSGRVERAYLVEKRKLTVEGDFNHLGGPSEIRRNLRERGLEPIDTFSAYSQRFHDMLFLPRGKSPMDIFNQAVCIKDITNLTQFIRDYMLDDGGAAEKLDSLRRNFDELRLTYERIETATRQLEALNEIHREHEEILAVRQQRDHWNACNEALPLFFAEKEIVLREREVERLDAAHAKHRADKEIAENEQERLSGEIASLDKAIEDTSEGKRLQKIDEELKHLEPELKERRERRERYDARLRDWQPGLALDGENAFSTLVAEIDRQRPKLEQEAERLSSTRAQRDAERQQQRADEEKLNGEIRYLLDRRTNIPSENANARSFIAQSLGVEESAIPFAGELLQVREQESRWTGAIERLLRNFGLCLLVPEELRSKVDAFVHAHRQKWLVVYYPVPADVKAPASAPLANTVAAKLEIKPDAERFRPWIERELNRRFAHTCLEEAGEEFHTAESALTINGLIKQRGSERRKDDRHALEDRSRHVLGWDNRAKIEALKERLQERIASGRNLEREIDDIKTRETAIRNRLKAAERLGDIAATWKEIEWESVSLQMETLRREAKELEKSSNALQTLRQQRAGAVKKREACKKQFENAVGELRGVDDRRNRNNQRLEACRTIVVASEAADAETGTDGLGLRDRLFGALTELLAFPLKDLDRVDEAREQVGGEVSKKRTQTNNRLYELSEKIKRRMQHFADSPENLSRRDELVTEGLDVPGYNDDLYEPFGRLRGHIMEEDLPKNRTRFESLLHNNVVEEVANFDGLLDQQAQRIQRRIGELNEQLREIAYDRTVDTFIALAPTRTSDEHQRRFRDLRRHALEGSLNAGNDRDELRERYQRIEHLLRELEKDEAWTRRVIDVRNWFEFRADEFFRSSGELRQSYSGSSGKSGGEKNRLASTILATAIAYQYGISVDNRQSDTFRLVVVDEMFSKTDDEFSTYLLELFKEFHLQLIIVQPLDSKIHLVQKYVERYHIVTRRGDVSAIRNMTVTEYEEARRDALETAVG